jgi:hypothetical protein
MKEANKFQIVTSGKQDILIKEKNVYRGKS